MQLQITVDPHAYGVRLAPKEPATLRPDIARKYFASFLNVTSPGPTLAELAQRRVPFATR